MIPFAMWNLGKCNEMQENIKKLLNETFLTQVFSHLFHTLLDNEEIVAQAEPVLDVLSEQI